MSTFTNSRITVDPSWYHAVTLCERSKLFRLTAPSKHDYPVDGELAKKRQQRWLSQKPFDDADLVKQRLDLDNLSEAEFLRILGEPIEAVSERSVEPPTWMTTFLEANSAENAPSSYPFNLPEEFSDQDTAAFWGVAVPTIRHGVDCLHQGVRCLEQKFAVLPFDADSICDLLIPMLLRRLQMMLSRTWVLEMHVAKLQGIVKGKTPQERYQFFFKHLQQQDARMTFFREYPVLARQLTQCIDNWMQFSLEFLQHLCVDWDEIRDMFGLTEISDPLIKVQGDVGDSHCGGRTVLVATFKSGFKLVYKPRSLAMDVHFQDLLSWLNQRGNILPFRTLKILQRGDHGWEEVIEQRSCDSQEQVKLFYQRQGYYLALLYLLQASDFHSENLIAAGDQPILVDLETLFLPLVAGQEIRQSADWHISNILQNSVLRTLLLPSLIWADEKDNYEGVDISGLGGKEDQLSPQRMPYWEDAGTDSIHLAQKRMPMPLDQNRPMLAGANIDALTYAHEIVSGFRSMYRLLMENRDALLSADSPLNRFGDDTIRFLLRPTQVYGLLLWKSFHPNWLRDALERDRFFDHLWAEVKARPAMAQVIPFELADLQDADIPLFAGKPTSRDLWNSDGRRIADFFAEPGMVLVQKCLSQLSSDDMERQVWFIKASLATLAVGTDQAARPLYNLTASRKNVGRDRLIAAARAVGDRLIDQAIPESDGSASWITLNFVKERRSVLAPAGMSLYDGLAGIILFLVYLGFVTKEHRYVEIAEAGFRTVQTTIDQNENLPPAGIGAFDGLGGIIHLLTHIGVLWQRQEVLNQAAQLVAKLQEAIDRDEYHDIISGKAGLIGALLNLHRFRPSERTLETAVHCGDRLIECAQRVNSGLGWAVHGNAPLAGFSHGAAGFAWALAKLAFVTNQDRFHQAAKEAICYERTLFDVQAGNWRDIRKPGRDTPEAATKSSFMVAWCHGAPGIGMGRLALPDCLQDAKVQQEIDIAIETTLHQGFGMNHSLCHGDLGNLELLLLASRKRNDLALLEQVNRIAAMILDSIDEFGWRCGVPTGIETPGLMAGIAGIGYGLLRIAASELVPSVLLLEPPQ